MTSVYGEILVVSQLEAAVKDLLIKWFPAYLREIERQVGWEREPLDTPKQHQYSVRNSFDVQKGEEMPKVVIVNPGLFSPPIHIEGDGYYRATWVIDVCVAYAQRNEDLAAQVRDMYGAAVRLLMIDHQDLDTDEVECVQVEWVDENYDDIPGLDDQIQLYKNTTMSFAITLDKIANRWMKPSEPSEQPEVLIPVDEVIVDVDRLN
jgi:hypothetical protein